MATISISLVSHTNAGKTTLARTLLGRDVGEVRDEVHVTLEAEPHVLIDTPAGDRLELWDTPGFGDSVRLARRMARSGQPLGWFLGAVWDRFSDRAAWSSQQALRHVLDRSDVVLFVVNASESPDEAAFLAAELKVLALTGKPVIAVLNQLGPPRSTVEEAEELLRWRRHLASSACVREVMSLDAFSGCWVQEALLLDAIDRVLARSCRDAFSRLHVAWTARHRARWHDAMRLLAARLARAAVDQQVVEDGGLGSRLKEAGAALGWRQGAATPRELAMQRLSGRMDADLRASTDGLIRLHGLDGRATEQVLKTLTAHFAGREPLTEGKAALFGGMAAGALAGLKADLATGGLTLGGGLLAGGLIGALGGAGIARGYNLVRGVSEPTLAWSDVALDEFTRVAMIGYLAVIHHGRGRGPWTDGTPPDFWQPAVDEAVASHGAGLHATWRDLRSTRTTPADQAFQALVAGLASTLVDVSAGLLSRLYPDTAQIAVGADVASPSAIPASISRT